MPRAVAQLGSALDWGSRGRRFKSCQPDCCDVDLGRADAELEKIDPLVFELLNNRGCAIPAVIRNGVYVPYRG